LRLSEEGKKSFAKAGALEQELQFLAGWFEGLTASKELLWNWLADQAELAADHHALVEDMQKMEEELARRWPERIYRAVARRFSSCVF
jgi:hypothetical protein